jgi:sugar phosphate isomerase/epimerase
MKQTRLLLTVLGTVWLAMTPATPALASQAGTGRSFKGPIGLQLYSLRDQFKQDVPGTLRQVRDFGFRYVELAGTYGIPPADFNARLKALGLKAIAGHMSYEQWRDHPEAAVAEAKALGLKYAGCAWIPHQGDFDEQECREAIRVFNRAGKVAAAQGIKFFYHIHGYEFHPHGQGTLLDLMFAETDPRLVVYEMDIFWAALPNQDPVELLKKYGKRWELMHLKDMRQGTPRGSLSGGTDVRNDAALGAGVLDMSAILKAARKAGVKWYFIEDESPWVLEQIPQSLRYLETVKF